MKVQAEAAEVVREEEAEVEEAREVGHLHILND